MQTSIAIVSLFDCTLLIHKIVRKKYTLLEVVKQDLQVYQCWQTMHRAMMVIHKQEQAIFFIKTCLSWMFIKLHACSDH